MTKTITKCHCLTLHTYAASVTLGAWDVVTHVCRCGRVHLEEAIPEAPPTAKGRPSGRRSNRSAKQGPGKNRNDA
jgi:hypothetical protein